MPNESNAIPEPLIPQPMKPLYPSEGMSEKCIIVGEVKNYESSEDINVCAEGCEI